MPRLPTPRCGEVVEVRGRPLRFSYWPMYRGSRRFGLQSHLFATDPWNLISSCINARCSTASRPEAIACGEQARDFHAAALTAKITASRPLLLYYCFMNVVKAYCLTIGQQTSFDQAQHGLSQKMRAGGNDVVDAFLEAHPSPGRRTGFLNVFDELLKAMRGTGLNAPTNFDIVSLIPQVVAGHRLWSDAAGKQERFIAFDRIEICQDCAARTIWMRLHMFADDLSRLGVTHARLLQESNLDGAFREVHWDTPDEGRRLLCFDQVATTGFRDRASDKVQEAVSAFRHNLWVTITSVPPYRRYYLYLCPAVERASVLPQLVSLYAIMYYLGSVTRYKPHHFDALLAGNYGSFVQEFISSQPSQFLYLMASEFAQQEVTRPALV